MGAFTGGRDNGVESVAGLGEGGVEGGIGVGGTGLAE